MSPSSLHLFEGFGIEIEYILVDRDTLSVLPIADEVLKSVAGDHVAEVAGEAVKWSNELVLHVVELKTAGPSPWLEGLDSLFQEHVRRVEAVLESFNGRLMPTGMHPWMDPLTETRLWPHEHNSVYETLNRIFDCRGHGWANLQSTHLNLPFADVEEFARLHAAVRLLLPILPALAAGSPLVEGSPTGKLDNRLFFYRSNASRVPSVTGTVIPEAVSSPAEYREAILEPMYRAIAPYDPEGILRHEWLNARGAIARFDRGTIEIRLLDVQEAPLADLAVCYALVAVLRNLTDGRWSDDRRQLSIGSETLAAILDETIERAEMGEIRSRRYLECFGYPGQGARAGELWSHLVETSLIGTTHWERERRKTVDVILGQGPLARRILRALQHDVSPGAQRAVYRELCDCLREGRLFEAPG